MHRPSTFRAILLAVLAIVMLAAGCSSDAGQLGDAASETVGSTQAVTTTSSRTETTTTEPSEEPPTPTTQASAEAAPSDESSTATVTPVRPYDDDPPVPDDTGPVTSIWLSRVEMSSASIEMTWSDVEGAVDYRLHRLPRSSDDRPDPSEMTSDNEIYVATGNGRTVDDSVEAGTKYWYGIRGFDADGTFIAHGWHRADAVDDLEPPSPVEIVSATVVDGEVQVTWVEPAENYALHAYRILRSVGGAEFETLATTWNLDQRTLIDDDPPTGTVTYAVMALDFHWNKSTPLGVEVEVP